MDAWELPDISSLLVTADNPARTDLLGMDYIRCAALHKYLVHYAWVAEGRVSTRLQEDASSYFETHSHIPDAADMLLPRLDRSVAGFLTEALEPSTSPAPTFFYAGSLMAPDDLFAKDEADLFDEPEDSLLILYYPNVGQGGDAGGGVYYHQRIHRAAVFMHMDDHDFALPVEEHMELWHPLETILSNWIELIHLGKVVASPRDEPALFGSEKVGPWEWRPYSQAQVASCVGAWDRLCEAIEARISPLLPHTDMTVDAAKHKPLLESAALDVASVPDNCFARDFLTRARRPRFRCIAPGIILPSVDAAVFAATQPSNYTQFPGGPQVIPPICLFPAASVESEVSLISLTEGSGLPAGVYSESVDRQNYDITEEGFRLLLPYSFEGSPWNTDAVARQSDGSIIDRGKKVADLFQHGYKPFGGDYYRPQRLERLFDHWLELVDRGVWSVGLQGVEGTIDTFKEADGVRWKDYIIPPTW
ncbi:hypothetical protein F4777DRAFT_507374 [Nemania sp. FL0916]|nr:hypothetical protein F4777DRAFT_507374 [Nemania sp. FL0916]